MTRYDKTLAIVAMVVCFILGVTFDVAFWQQVPHLRIQTSADQIILRPYSRLDLYYRDQKVELKNGDVYGISLAPSANGNTVVKPGHAAVSVGETPTTTTTTSNIISTSGVGYAECYAFVPPDKNKPNTVTANQFDIITRMIDHNMDVISAQVQEELNIKDAAIRLCRNQIDWRNYYCRKICAAQIRLFRTVDAPMTSTERDFERECKR